MYIESIECQLISAAYNIVAAADLSEDPDVEKGMLVNAVYDAELYDAAASFLTRRFNEAP